MQRIYEGEPGGSRESDAVMESRLEPNDGKSFATKVSPMPNLDRHFLELGEYPSEKCGWVAQRVAMGLGVPVIASLLSGIPGVNIAWVVSSVFYIGMHVSHLSPKEVEEVSLEGQSKVRKKVMVHSPYRSRAFLGLLIYLSCFGYIAVAQPEVVHRILNTYQTEQR